MQKSSQETLIHVGADGVTLEGALQVPQAALGVVLFAHGSGSSRLSPRNNFVARSLQQAGLATLLIDLLTPAEDRDYATRFDIPLLTQRLLATTRWLQQQAATAALPIGYFGASTGAAAALQAAAQQGGKLAAVVSRGGRPDLAGEAALKAVRAPTLLIVGGHDDAVIELNRQAYGLLQCVKELVIIPGATHLFEEPGTLEQVAVEAGRWFVQHLGAGARGRT